MDQTKLKELHLWAQAQGLSRHDDGYYFLASGALGGHIKWDGQGHNIYLSVFLDLQTVLPDPVALRSALALNQFQEATQGGVIAFDPIANDLLLTLTLKAENCDGSLLANCMANLIPCAQSLQNTIQSASDGLNGMTNPRISTKNLPETLNLLRV